MGIFFQSVATNGMLSFETLMEQIKPVVKEKHRFGNSCKSELIEPFGFFGFSKLLFLGTELIVLHSNSPHAKGKLPIQA